MPKTAFPLIRSDELRKLFEARKDLFFHAMDHRHDYQALKWNAKASDALVVQARKNLQPDVSVVGSTGYVSASEDTHYFDSLWDDLSSPEWSLALSYSHSLENRSAKGLLKSRQSSFRSVQLSMAQLKQDILGQVSQSLSQLLTAEARIQASSESVKNYQDSVDDEREKYRSGLSTQLQIIDTQDRLASSQADLINAYADLARGVTNLSYSCGALLKEEKELTTFTMENLLAPILSIAQGENE